MPVSLADLNAMDRTGFVAALGEVFEHAPWVAKAAYVRRPFASGSALHNALVEVVAAQTPGQITRFLNGHPDLVGRPSPGSPLTAHSAAEQKGAGLDAITAAEAARLSLWNRRYREKFGFPFIICVRRHGKDSIFAEFERRLARQPDVELRAALDEIGRISALRLVTTLCGPGMPKVYGKVSTHLLDNSRGLPAAGVPVQLLALSAEGSAQLVAEAITNHDGRPDAPLIDARPIPIGWYELRFFLGRHFARDVPLSGPPFLDMVPVRFNVAEPEGHYHIPLLFTPWSYSTYRGS
jgi:2-oxo-4-hydroxy-4-carboxy-5-ureidoimidazoline decarboxylase